MNLLNTGNLIQTKRKQINLTQLELAQKLNVSEKTISKWECGKGFPETSLILPLCKELNITANELLSGKLLPSDKEYRENAEENLVELKNLQEKNSKHLLTIEWIVLWFSLVIFLTSILVPTYVNMPILWKISLIVFGILNLSIGFYFSIVIETKAGFYECKHCQHKYIPTYNQVLWSMHMARTRYMKCPKCHKKSWSKKTISKN